MSIEIYSYIEAGFTSVLGVVLVNVANSPTSIYVSAQQLYGNAKDEMKIQTSLYDSMTIF